MHPPDGPLERLHFRERKFFFVFFHIMQQFEQCNKRRAVHDGISH